MNFGLKMKIFKSFNFIVLLTFSSLTWAVTPVGSWQLITTTKLDTVTPKGKTISSAVTNGNEFATFFSDYSYLSSEWINKFNIFFRNADNGTSGYVMPLSSYGQWYNKTSTTYNVTYDKFLLSFTDGNSKNINATFFDRVGINKFLTTSVGYSPTFDSIQVLSYRDDGTVTGTGKIITGTKKIAIKATWKRPDNTTDTTPASAVVNVTTKYTGKPYIQSNCCGTDGEKNKADSSAFLANVGKLSGVSTTQSGIRYIVLQDNLSGEKPIASTDTVTVNYRGFLPSGQIFDSNSSISFQLSNVIKGWTEGLQLMKKGSKYRFFIPSDLAYGQAGSSTIPANSALIFDVELIDIKH
jgi:FKBP-type peptidyl-prolyl cis-trans isomerase